MKICFVFSSLLFIQTREWSDDTQTGSGSKSWVCFPLTPSIWTGNKHQNGDMHTAFNIIYEETKRRREGEMERWSDGVMERWRDGAMDRWRNRGGTRAELCWELRSWTFALAHRNGLPTTKAFPYLTAYSFHMHKVRGPALSSMMSTLLQCLSPSSGLVGTPSKENSLKFTLQHFVATCKALCLFSYFHIFVKNMENIKI